MSELPPPKLKWYKDPLRCLGCVLLVLIFVPFLYVLGGVFLIGVVWWYKDIPRTGEHLPSAAEFSKEATNYSYHTRLLNQVREFDIPEDAFLKMSEEKYAGPEGDWKPVEIERIPLEATVKPSGPDSYPRVNAEKDVPFTISRYVWEQPAHERCRAIGMVKECEVDPSGKTDASCFHSVSTGWYYEVRHRDGGGLKILYDRENGRCYMHYNPW